MQGTRRTWVTRTRENTGQDTRGTKFQGKAAAGEQDDVETGSMRKTWKRDEELEG